MVSVHLKPSVSTFACRLHGCGAVSAGTHSIFISSVRKGGIKMTSGFIAGRSSENFHLALENGHPCAKSQRCADEPQINNQSR